MLVRVRRLVSQLYISVAMNNESTFEYGNGDKENPLHIEYFV